MNCDLDQVIYLSELNNRNSLVLFCIPQLDRDQTSVKWTKERFLRNEGRSEKKEHLERGR
jgi:hypothetical protein